MRVMPVMHYGTFSGTLDACGAAVKLAPEPSARAVDVEAKMTRDSGGQRMIEGANSWVRGGGPCSLEQVI